MPAMTRSLSLVLFGLLTLGMACGNSKSSARDGGMDGAKGGSSGTQPTVGGHGGSSQDGDGGSSGGNSAGGKPDAGRGGAGVDGGPGPGGSSGTSMGGNTGSAGRSTAGNTGTGGRGSAGTTAGSATSTGAAGNTGSGGSQTGGAGGHTRVDGGGADVGPGHDAAVEAGRQDGPTDLPRATDTGNGAMTLDACFADVPKPVGNHMLATKQSSDKRVRIRIALDTEGFIGTSGTVAWRLIRLAVEVDGEVTCIKDRASLEYKLMHHNCGDTATAKSGSTSYSLSAPDRGSTGITISDNGASKGTWNLTDTACTMANASGVLPGECRSGGPC